MENRKLYTVDEVAEILQVTRRTLYTYIHDGRIQAIKIGKQWRVSNQALDEFLQDNVNIIKED